MGAADRIVRLIIAVAIFFLWFDDVIKGTAGIILLVVAGIFVATSLVGSCPLYMLFGLQTNKKKRVTNN